VLRATLGMWNLESGIYNLEPFGCAQGSVWNPSAVLRATP